MNSQTDASFFELIHACLNELVPGGVMGCGLFLGVIVWAVSGFPVNALSVVAAALLFVCLYWDNDGTGWLPSGSWMTGGWGQTSVPGEPIAPGAVGLSNMGNTCYMNAILQCVFQTPGLRQAFEAGRPSNGKDSAVYENLVDSLGALYGQVWSGEFVSVRPTNTRDSIARTPAARRAGLLADSQQHDAQELLQALLEELHDALNCAPSSPRTTRLRSESLEGASLGTAKVAERAWQNFLAGNRSAVSQLFQGQYRSELRCESCGKCSYRFGDENCLIVEIPQPTHRWVPAVLVRANGEPPVRYGLTIPVSGAAVETVAHELSAVSEMPVDQMLPAQVRSGTLRILPADTPLAPPSAWGSPGASWFFQVDWSLTNAIVMHRQGLSEGPQQSWCSYPMPLGVPMLLPIAGGSLRHAAIEMALAAAKLAVQDDAVDVKQELLQVCVVHSDGISCGLCREKQCHGCPLPMEALDLSECKQLYLTVDWVPRGKVVTALRAAASQMKELGEAESPAAPVHLSQCVKSYTTPEHLEGVQCDKCRCPVNAQKQLELWRLPQVVVVTLKRFQHTAYGSSKVNTQVEIPINQLDFGPSLAEGAPPSSQYELFGFVDHHGIMGGGHYLATTRHLENNRWFLFDDTRVTEKPELSQRESFVSSSAYILFYRIKRKPGLETSPSPKSPSKAVQGSASKVGRTQVTKRR